MGNGSTVSLTYLDQVGLPIYNIYIYIYICNVYIYIYYLFI